MSTAKQPKWAWFSVDDPNPIYPKCDRCEAFAKWSFGEFEDGHPERLAPTIRYFACGRHVSAALVGAAWHLDALMVYDLTYPPERG